MNGNMVYPFPICTQSKERQSDETLVEFCISMWNFLRELSSNSMWAERSVSQQVSVWRSPHTVPLHSDCRSVINMS